jgi:class 3 adenylate cyclase/HAMP domain-containing protein
MSTNHNGLRVQFSKQRMTVIDVTEPRPSVRSRLGPWKIPLRLFLVVPFVVQISVAVGLTGWLSLKNGEQAVNDLASQLRAEIGARIDQQLQNYLQVPRTLDRINAHAIELGQIDITDTASLTRQFWRQRDLFKPVVVSALYFGGADGEFIGLGFQNDNTWQVGRAGAYTEGKFHSYATDDRGNPTDLLEVGNPYDPRLRPWYRNAIEAKQTTWSDIYVDFKDPRLKITLVEPIYRDDGSLLGVLGVDFVLSHIRSFLQGLQIGQSGQTFIMERSGLLVASSVSQDPFNKVGDRVERIKAEDVEDPLIRNTARMLDGYFNRNLDKITQTRQLQFQLDGEKHFVQVMPFSDGENLDWLIVIVVPEADFMERIHVNTRTTIQLCAIALIVASLLGWIASRWITQPILRLSEASMEIAEGNFNQKIRVKWPNELVLLANSFNRMSVQLKSSHDQLAEYSRSLEHKVRERTIELQQEKEKSEQLLLNILPKPIAERLKNDRSAIAEHFDCVTILFADIVGFTQLSARLTPSELVEVLNQIFSVFDELSERHQLEKIKTIGDAYMVVGGLPLGTADPTAAIADMALEMQRFIRSFRTIYDESFQIRIGIHCGSVVAGVIGTKKFIYDLWGDTVNVASRMESQGSPGQIQVTEAVYSVLRDRYHFEKRGAISVKGKGEMTTYWLVDGRSPPEEYRI